MSVPLHKLLFIAALVAVLGACASSPQPLPALPGGRDAGSEVAVRAMSMIGVPYRWGGNSPKAGFDCSGLVRYVYREALGVELPRVAAAMGRQGVKVQRTQLRPGDLVFFNTQRRRFSHVGIYVGKGRFVHAPSAGKSIRLAKLNNPYWRKRYNGARRPDAASSRLRQI